MAKKKGNVKVSRSASSVAALKQRAARRRQRARSNARRGTNTTGPPG